VNGRALTFALGVLLAATTVPGAGYCREAGVSHEQEREAHEIHEQRGDAYSSGEYDEVRSLQQRGAILSLQHILERARRYHEGRVLETELERKGERYIYEIELVDDQGQVWELKFDAGSGELLKEKQEN
jgi:uncharacterized membrane protein YkoI